MSKAWACNYCGDEDNLQITADREERNRVTVLLVPREDVPLPGLERTTMGLNATDPMGLNSTTDMGLR